jgi:hypothetical protein
MYTKPEVVAAAKQRVCYISACGLDRNAISTANPTFLGYRNTMDPLGILCHQTRSGQSKMAADKQQFVISEFVD